MTRFLLAALAVAAALLPRAGSADPVLVDDTGAVTRIFDLVAERLSVMPQVAATKWLSGTPVTDPAREQAVLDRAVEQGRRMALAPQAVHDFFAQQIQLGRDRQLQLHEEWRRSRCAPCQNLADLAALRTHIDRINDDLLRALYVAQPVLAGPEFVERFRPLAAAQLASAVPLASDRDRLLATLHAMAFTQPAGLARVRSSGILRVATTGDYAPFSLESGGRVHGSDIALALALAEHLGVTAVFVRTTWSSLLADLADGKFDVALSGISVTGERGARGSFSVPYQSGGKTILARCADRRRYDTLAAVDRSQVRVIVNPGGTNERYVREHLHRARVIVHPDNRTIFDEIVARHADVMITDDVEADLQALRRPALCRTYPGTLTSASKAIFMPADADLKDAVDGWLGAAIAQGVPTRLLQEATNEMGAN